MIRIEYKNLNALSFVLLKLLMVSNLKAKIEIFVFFVNLLASIYFTAQVSALTDVSNRQITINDSKLRAEVVFRGLNFPTSMAFLGPDDILVLEKNNGTVNRIVDGKMLPNSLFQAEVSTVSERGLLGIALDRQTIQGSPYVFLYFTETDDKTSDKSKEQQTVLGNRVYRYELLNDKLTNSKLLLDLPANPGPAHNGGKMVIGPDHNLYIVIGDLYGSTILQNIANGRQADGTGGILRITQDGKPVNNGILGSDYPLSLYYAYGIRNSFGIAFDAVSGKLWDTENGPYYGDEINLVQSGFNSGWKKIQGIWKDNDEHRGEIAPLNPHGLVNMNGKGKYSLPEFTWNNTVGVTGIDFLNSDKLGKQYENNLFVGDFHNGNLYNFKLSSDRSQLVLGDSLADKIADNEGELKNVLFGQGFGAITDVKTGPDGYLYVLSIKEGGTDCRGLANEAHCIPYDSGVQGTIFRIVSD
jgi:glucose/arabinose dehydrogenase